MPLVRRLARPLLASSFVAGGIETLRNPKPRVPGAAKVVSWIPAKVSFLRNTEQLVKIDAAAKVLGGMLLATGRLPRPVALGLAVSLVPTTLAGHRFWEETDEAKRKAQQAQFLKNASVFGGLILAAVDTEGKPSLGWRTRAAAAGLGRSAGGQVHFAADKLSSAAGVVSERLPVG